MTTATLTAAELYRTSADMRGFVRFWVRRRRCPLPFVDFLTEFELVSQAACARWCAMEPDRPEFDYRTFMPMGRACGPTPMRGALTSDRLGRFYVWCATRHRLSESCDCVPEDNVPGFPDTNMATATAAILVLLDAWKETP